MQPDGSIHFEESCTIPLAQQNKKINLHGAPSWSELEEIADHLDVHMCLQNFSDDSTGDNATCIVRAVLEATERQTDYEYIRDEGIELLISALGVDPDGDEAEPWLLANFLKEFVNDFIVPNGIKWVDHDEFPGYQITSMQEPKIPAQQTSDNNLIAKKFCEGCGHGNGRVYDIRLGPQPCNVCNPGCGKESWCICDGTGILNGTRCKGLPF